MNRFHRLHFRFFGMLLILSMPAHANAEAVLVVAENSPIHKLSRHEVADIFLGNSRNQPRLGKVVPLDLAQEELRQEFYQAYLGKSLPQVKAHWAKIIFTGRGYPPRTVSNAEELKNVLRDNPNAVGYAERSAVDGTLRIVKLD
jgi:ABC-type phosphate transport system substrate-binding protein